MTRQKNRHGGPGSQPWGGGALGRPRLFFCSVFCHLTVRNFDGPVAVSYGPETSTHEHSSTNKTNSNNSDFAQLEEQTHCHDLSQLDVAE